MKKLLHCAVLWLAFALAPAHAQFAIGDGKPLLPPTVSQAGLMSGRGTYVDPDTAPPYQMNGHPNVRITTTCTGTYNSNGTDPYCNHPTNDGSGVPNPTTIIPAYDNAAISNGSFRLSCDFVRAAPVDPVVLPGNKTGISHFHGFYGNIHVNPFSTHASLLANPESSCYGGTLNATGYWFPMPVAHCPPGSTDGCLAVLAKYGWKDGHMFAPSVNIYYKQERGQDSDTGSYGGLPMQWVPQGLVMIAGDAGATTNAKFSGTNDGYRWYCFNHAGGATDPLDHIPNAADIASIGSCSQATQGNGQDLGDLKAVIGFPYCWNGAVLDSPGTHNAHVAYGNTNSGACSAAFPILMPQVELQLHWQVPDDVIPFLRLSSDPPKSSGQPAGYTLHADYLEGWMQKTPQPLLGGLSIEDVLMSKCYMLGYAAANAGQHVHADCHNNLLGNPDPANPTLWKEMY